MRASLGSLGVAVLLALAAPATAHLGLRYPPSRYGDDVLKIGPCGTPGGVRSDHVTLLEPGAQIEVTWDEYVDHPGHFRIAFDADGDDDFADPACLDGCTTRMPAIELYSNDAVLLDGIADTLGGPGSATVTLPDLECETCTLQVIQVMYDKPPYLLGGDDIYYQCADLALRRSEPVPCAGDCDDDHHVSVEEIVSGIRILLGLSEMVECPSFDSDADGHVQVDDVVRAVRGALGSCAP